MEDDLYPLILSYTQPDGKSVSVRCDDSDEAEDAYHQMFRDCGQDVLFSVDSPNS